MLRDMTTTTTKPRAPKPPCPHCGRITYFGCRSVDGGNGHHEDCPSYLPGLGSSSPSSEYVWLPARRTVAR